MPVSFTVASHPAESISGNNTSPKPEDVLRTAYKAQDTKVKEILQSSFSPSQGKTAELGTIQPRGNGLVHTVVSAYNQHHHLILRPDDIWMAILSQFNFFVNAHSEDLRSSFVQHEGKKTLTVKAAGTRYTVDFGSLARQFTDAIDANIVDKALKDWILPNFSTTTSNDTVVCAVLMMSTLKSYFDFKISLMCGLPSVTLEGTQSDWDSVIGRLDKLSSFGTEPAAFAAMLRPVLNRFVQAFKNAETGSPQDVDFWNRICHSHPAGSGPTLLSGWITAFCAWDEKGKWLGPAIKDTSAESGSIQLIPKKVPSFGGYQINALELDGVSYSFIDIDNIPPAYCEVDVKLNDNGEEMDCVMMSGLMADVVEGKSQDTLRPLPSWFIFVVEKNLQKSPLYY